MAVIAFVVAALVGAATPVSAQTLRGLLLERDTQLPINLGSVTLITVERDSVDAALTNADGFFSVTAPEPGIYQLVGSALGYRGSLIGPFELEDGAVQVVQLELAVRPVAIAGVAVSAERLNEPEVATLVATGFYDRMAEGIGQFITPGEIEASTVRYTPQLFRELTFIELVPNRTVASAPWNDKVWVKPPDPGALDAGRICQPRVYVDNVFIDLENMEPQPSLEDLVRKEDLEAVEVFRGRFGAPMRYHSDSGCGVILLWTKLR